MRHLPATLATVARTVEDLLAEHGPLTERRLADALTRSGLVLGAPADEVLDDLRYEDVATLTTLHDGRWAHLPTLVCARPFTHRLSEVEVAHDLLAIDPDLAATLLVADDPRYAHLADGSPLVTAFPDLDPEVFVERGVPTGGLPDSEMVVLPPGTLAGTGAAPGDVVVVRLTDRGWEVAPCADALADPTRLRRRVREWLGQREPLDLVDVVHRLCGTSDAFTRPELPLTELLDAWDLERHVDLVARAGFDVDAWRLQQHADQVARLHRIGDDDAFAVVVLAAQVVRLDAAITDALRTELDAVDPAGTRVHDDAPADAATLPGDEPDGADDDLTDRDIALTLATSLADPDVAEAFLAEALGTGRDRAAALGMLAESLVDDAPEDALPALHWLVAKARERLAHVTEAEESLRASVTVAPWEPALRDLARYESDHGHAREALDLLRRAGVDRRDPEVQLLEQMSTTAATSVGRNQPCWCGSGRKYKVCHLGKEQLPLSERAAWLYQKAGTYLHDGPWRDVVVEVAVERARHSRSDAALVQAVQDGVVTDAVLFEGGAFRAFLDERGPLLPDDERLLAEQWLLVERSVHEVVDVRRGASLVLRDVRTGDVHTVRERTASRTLRPGTLLCARVVPAGDSVQVFGGVQAVSVGEVDELVALLDSGPAPQELVAFLSRGFGPPVLRTTDGEALVQHEATLRASDPTALVAHLDTALLPDEGMPGRRWHMVDGEGSPVRAVVELSGSTVDVQAMSDERFEAVMAVLRRGDPAVEVFEHQRVSAEEMAELIDRFPDLLGGPDRDTPAGGISADHPDVAGAIATMMRRYEDSWPDEPVPALGGRTPRAAAADPTRRDDVVRLLAAWPEPTPQSMDKYRIAGLLGIDLPTAR